MRTKRPNRGIRNYPGLLLTLAGLGLAAWVAHDLLTPAAGPRPQLLPEVLHGPVNADVGDVAAPIEELVARRPPPSAAVLPRLKPGMRRVEVETLLGPPEADDLTPVSTADGRTTYRMAYEFADPDPVVTVRPIHAGRPRVIPSADVKLVKSFVALEFDATRPGHPLVAIHYLDPLF